MPICSSGISQIKAGSPPSIVVDQQYIQSLLPAGLAWAYPYLPFMHGLQIGDVATFCSVDPPTWTTPTGAEIFSFLTGGPLAEVQAVSDFLQAITQAYLWYSLCECASVATPAPPTPPTAPSGLPAVNPPGVVDNAGGPCASFDFSFHNPFPQVGLLTEYIPLPAGVTSVRSVATWGPGDGNVGHFAQMYIEARNPSNAGYPGLNTCGTTPGEHIATTTFSTTAKDFRIDGSGNNLQAPSDWSAHIEFFCGTATSGVGGGQSCLACPPDPILTGLLNQILQLVTVQQRQNVPFAYISGPLHSGLTGTGTISVSGILGLLANVSVPNSTGLIAGTPDVRLPLGRVNFATTDGYTDRYELVTDSQLILPTLPGLYTIVGYSLEPGVTLALTELRREF